MSLHEYFHDDEGFIFYCNSMSNKSIIYIVAVDKYDGWYCSCEDYQFRKHKCKHIRLCQDYIRYYYPNEYPIYEKMPVFCKKKDKWGEK